MSHDRIGILKSESRSKFRDNYEIRSQNEANPGEPHGPTCERPERPRID